MKSKIGLLPFYLELYDRALPEARTGIENFYRIIADELKGRSLEVVRAPICRLKNEFEAAVKLFENSRVDAMVTLHLAYSPSLESAEVLAATTLPLIVLDTTPAAGFGPTQNPEEIIYNHGIHGVQDMCNLLIRRGKFFRIEAGPWEKSTVLDRVVSGVRSARIATKMRSARVGQIGNAFRGMGDFALSPQILKQTIGIETVKSNPSQLRSFLPRPDDEEVEKEMADNMKNFTGGGFDAETHRCTGRACLAVRRWIEKERLSAFTMNFLEINESASGLPTVPFLEASKAMARGIGYAGEGDVLTAALTGALSSVYPATSFTEMFCPDWENESIFLSHMGEMNISLADNLPRLIEKPFPWTDTPDSLIAVGRF